MARIKFEHIDDYIASFPKESQSVLMQIRATIRKAAPGAEEFISYGIPAFRLHGRYLIYFAGFKNHTSLYPAPRGHEAFRKALEKYKGGKGTVQFPLDKPLPVSLITRIVKFRAKENEMLMTAKRKKKA